MPAGPSHIYFFQDALNRSVSWDNGLLDYNSSPKPLQYSPDGWKEISIVNQRNVSTWTLDIDFTIPLNFVNDGAQILKTWASTKGTEESLFLVIMEQRLFYDASTVPANYYYYYTLIYRSGVDWSSYSHQGPRVSVNMLDQSFATQLKNNSSKTYQYNLADSHLGGPIYFDGIDLTETANFQIIDGVPYSDATISRFAVAFGLLNQEGQAKGVQFKIQEFETFTSPATYTTTSGNWFAKADDTNSGNITLILNGTAILQTIKNDNSQGQFFIEFRSSKGQNLTINLPGAAIPAPGGDLTLTLTRNIILQPGEALFLTGFITNVITGAIENSIKFLPSPKTMVKFTNRFDPTLVKAFDIQEVFSRLVNSITGGTFVAAPSKMLSKIGLKIAITSGDGIRSITGAILKITWKNLWSFANMYEDAALYIIGNQVFLERKEDAIDWASIIDIGQVSGLQNSPANDLKFNLLKIGYPNQDYGATNGKDEFNTTLEMGAPVTSVSTEIDFISDIRGDGFGGEFARTGLDGKTTTDSTADGTPFAFHIEDNPVIRTVGAITGPAYRFNRDLNPYCSGVLAPSSVINLALSPKQCLYRKGNYLLGCLDKLQAKELTFQTLDKNQLLKVLAPGKRPVIENSNEVIGDLGVAYFKPWIYDSTGLVPNDIIQLRKRNPLSVIRFSVGSISYLCLPMKEGIQPDTNAAQAYQFLAGPDNDITQLNNYYGD